MLGDRLTIAKFAIERFFDYSQRQFARLFSQCPTPAKLTRPLNDHKPKPNDDDCQSQNWQLVFAAIVDWLAWNLPDGAAQNRPPTVRTAYSALSAGIGTLWLTHDEGYFKKHGLDSNLIYIRGGTTAVQALARRRNPVRPSVAGAHDDGLGAGRRLCLDRHDHAPDGFHPANRMRASPKVPISKARKSASRASARPAISPCARRSNNSVLAPKDVTMISLGGIPDILAAMRAGAVNAGILVAADIDRSARHRLPAFAAYSRLGHGSLLFPGLPPAVPSFKANRKSRALTWRH